MLLNSANEAIELNENGAVVRTEQTIGEDYFQELQALRDDFAFRLNGLTPVASIPETTVNRWYREGFDFDNASSRDIREKLISEGNDGMLVTDKTF